MKFFRSERVSSLIREQLGELILREIGFDGALATITDVEVDKKMEHAKVTVSVIPSDRTTAVVGELDRKAGYLQHLLMKKINIKPMPRIAFVIDRGYENAAVVEKKLMEGGIEAGGEEEVNEAD
jgi:ribosome-binding factor A